MMKKHKRYPGIEMTGAISIDKQKQRNGALDLLRVISCCGILYLHYRSYVSPDGVYWGDTLITAENSGIDLRCFVEVFFVLSGYLMYSYVERIGNGMKFGSYIAPKLWRILPILSIGTVVYQLLSYRLFSCGQDISYAQSSLWGIISSSLGVQEGWGFLNAHINPESWFLDVLILCYIWTYILVRICKKAGADPRWGFGLMIFVGAACVSRESSFPFFGYMAGRGYEAYFTGLLLAFYLKSEKKKRTGYLVAFAILAIYLLYHIFWPWLLLFGKFYLVAFFVAPALIVLAESEAARKLLSWKGFGTIGKITFATYVFHTVTLLGIRNLAVSFGLIIDFGHEIMLISYVFCAFAIGALAYLLVEKPVSSAAGKK